MTKPGESAPLAPAKTLVEIDEVSVEQNAPGEMFQFDAPASGARSEIYALQISGSMEVRRTVEAVAVTSNGRTLCLLPVQSQLIERSTALRRTAARIAPGRARQRFTFAGFVGMIGLPSPFQIELHALPVSARPRYDVRFEIGKTSLALPLPAGARRVAAVRGRRALLPAASNSDRTFQPLRVTAWGRSGTTWMMRLLASHPGIAVQRQHPYEFRGALYQMEMFKVLCEPGNALQSMLRDPFPLGEGLHWIGHNPFYDFPEMQQPAFARWCGRKSIEDLADFCRAQIEACYRSIIADEATTGAESTSASTQYFAEKAAPGHLPEMFWELYPQMREIILVRDPRDLVASALAFNAKRGFQAFGRAEVSSDRDYIALMRERSHCIWSAKKNRTPRAYFLHYEDLIREPHDSLRAVLEYLNLDASPATVEDVLQRAGEDTAELKFHRTTSNPLNSIGRWRRDLSPTLQAACRRELGEVLAALGYEP